MTEPEHRPNPTPWVGRCLLFVAIVFLLEHARPALLPIAIAIVFAFVLAAPVRALRRRGLHEYAAAALVLGATLGVLAAVAMVVAAPATAWWSRAPVIARELLEAVQQWGDRVFPYALPAGLSSAVAPAHSEALADRLASEGWSFTRLAIGETVAFAFSASATLILLFFLLASEHWLVARLADALRSPRARLRLLSGMRQAERDIGLFISTMSLVNIALGIVTGLALWAIGLPNPVLWAVTTAVLAFVPYLGPLAVTALLLLAGNVTFGNDVAMLGPPAVFLALHGVEANFLSPVIMGNRLSVRPVFVFLAVMLLGWLWGVAGAFLAVPLLLGLRAWCRRTPSLRRVHAFMAGD